jgi:hypothetical protein
MFEGWDREIGGWDSQVSEVESQLLATPAGAGLATLLESLEGTDLGESDRVAILQAWARLQAHVDAQVYSDMVAVPDAVAAATGSSSFDYQADEIEAALTLTRAAAADQLALAQMLVLRFLRLFETMFVITEDANLALAVGHDQDPRGGQVSDCPEHILWLRR